MSSHCFLFDGRGQILSFLLLGDLYDLNVFLLDAMDHSIGAMTPVTYAAMSRDLMETLCETHPAIAQALSAESLVVAAMQRDQHFAYEITDSEPGDLALLAIGQHLLQTEDEGACRAHGRGAGLSSGADPLCILRDPCFGNASGIDRRRPNQSDRQRRSNRAFDRPCPCQTVASVNVVVSGPARPFSLYSATSSSLRARSWSPSVSMSSPAWRAWLNMPSMRCSSSCT